GMGAGGPANPGTNNMNNGSSGSASGGNGAGGTDMPIDPDKAKTDPIDPGHVAMHRLNSAEYNATVADILGTTYAPADSNWRGGELGGFDNMAAVLGVDGDQYQRYFDAASKLVDEAFASDALRNKIVVCATTDDACIKQILDQTGTRIFRRPLTADEQATYKKVYNASKAQGDDHN